MYSITDPSFRLPEVLAQGTLGVAEGGANRPLIIKAVDLETQTTGDYVLKYRGSERMDEAACGRELFASFLAAALKIYVPLPAVVHVHDQFINTLTSHPDHSRICNSKGINFGSTYLTGVLNLTQSDTLSVQQMKQAARIILFDLLMQNADRRREKPNMFIHKENIYVIDHELPYGFLAMFSFLSTGNPWELTEMDINVGQRHFFYPMLRKKENIPWDEVGEPFLNIDNRFWDCARALIPAEWMSDVDFNRIKTHFISIQTHFETFKSEIWNKLLMA